MTIHSAKGLEFSHVFIIGCEDGLLPHTLYGADKCDMEEERRLFYVGMTRAKKRLFLSFAKQRNVYGRRLTLSVSPFLEDIREELLKKDKAVKRKARPKDKQMSLFS
jgi:superfamily I DNA/RNA helicase